MNDRAVSLFEKYDLTIEKTRKGRGAIIAETDKGTVALVEYSGPVDHLAVEEEVLRCIADRFDAPLDLIFKTSDEELYCSDYEGKKYIVKKYVEGTECNVADEDACEQAAGALARLHRAMRRIELSDGNDYLNKTDRLQEDFDRRTAEIVRTRNYIRKSPRKDEFELAFLRSYDRYLEQSATAYSFLDTECIASLNKKQQQESMLMHGDCTHHNVLFTGGSVTFVNFEKMGAPRRRKLSATFA